MNSEEHHMLRDATSDFLAQSSGPQKLRARHILTDQISAMGWNGILIHEQYGGAGMDVMSAVIVAQQIGRHLTLTPVLSSAILSSYALATLASGEQKTTWLPKIAAGDCWVTTDFSHGESALSAEREADDLWLSGERNFIPDVPTASAFLVSAQNDGEHCLCIIPADRENIEFDPCVTLDQRDFGSLTFDNVRVGQADILPESDTEAVISMGCLLYGAEQYGCAAAAFEMTTAYLKERRQFGRHIGSFQALQHRASVLYSELAVAEGLILKAAHAMDNADPEASLLCSMAKAKAGRTAILVANEAVQMHGGIGMTDEHDVGLYLKRIAVSEKLFGDPDYHTDRVARLSGF